MTANDPTLSPPILRRLWMVVLLTCIILTFPLAMIMLLSGPVYRWRVEGWQPIGNGPRYVYGSLLALWLVAVAARVILVPGSVSQDFANSANPDKTPATVPGKAIQSDTPAGGGMKADNYADSPAEVAKGPIPDIKVTTEETRYGPALILTDNDDQPFTIKRVVFNGREREKFCDLPEYGLDVHSTDMSNEAASMQWAYGSQLPVQMKRGDRAVFFSACGAPTKLDIYTDKGTKHMTSGG